MREILFRAKRIDNGEWGFGDLWHNNSETMIIDQPATIEYDVIPETVGQFTGLTDKNGKKIFEGDIVKENDIFHNGELQMRGNTWEVVYADGLFFANFKDISVYLQSLDGIEVIGNIHDNPGLMRKEDEK